MKRYIYALLLVLLAFPVRAQLNTFDWPTNAGQAILSDKYDVYVKLNNGTEQKLEVLMSNAIYEGDFRDYELKDRTFSFVNLDYKPVTSGAGLTFRIVKKFGTGASNATVSPKSYTINPALNNTGNQITFTLNRTNSYMSVYFETPDNQTSYRKWVKHMLCIFIDPIETGKPSKTGAGVVVYSPTVSAASLQSASIIYFPKGYHNLKQYTKGGIISSAGVLQVQNNQSVYLEGGAYVEGLINRQAYGNANQKIYGRGILTGRKFEWYNKPGYIGPRWEQLVLLGNTNVTIEGVTMLESPSHGIVCGTAKVRNLKMIGWHANNDCVRVSEGSEVANSFLRAVDDHFYNFDIWVHDCVLWAGHNGAILTYGWGGDGGRTYPAGGSILENIDIIHPEWIGLGNNNGLVAAQTGLDYSPFGYGGSPTTILRNIRIEGSIPGVFNLKPRSEGTPSVPVARQTALDSVGFLGDLVMENVFVENQFDKSRIEGQKNAAYNGNATYFVKDVQIHNLRIGGTRVTENNKDQYFTIDASTTRNIGFPATITNGIYVIETRHAGKALTVSNWSMSDGAAIQQWNRTDKPHQQWELTNLLNGYWKLTNVNSDKVMEVANSSLATKTPIQQRSSTGEANQQFRLALQSSGAYHIVARHSNSCLDLTNGSTEDRTPIQQWTCSTSLNQEFTFFRLAAPAQRQAASIASDDAVVLHPNPSVGSFSIKGLAPHTVVDIYDSTGKRMISQKTTASVLTISTQSLPKGLYIVRFSQANLSARKLVVE